ncbi:MULTISPECIES: response regulator [Pseudomonas]|jgi:CheY-like chemotaxis protein/chemotaxis protein CheY-P-specific phosphatase CheC|nr:MULTISPECIES: response regulator [Pseudomonas]KEZ67516.1 chemotaxis protein CheC [Pseudomonas syringae pv. syringae FF5]RMU70327.1 CheC-like chemotactic response regulator rotein [Pseudomonas syringae pv. aptata]AKF53094.1 Response regulator containing CheY-like receiverdomain and AraC-type DNA-binding domain [Pseudomonas syringae pv. syringae HS191]AZG85122.1 response regulator [Pseudomonas syringae pv. pisi str. PP1]ELS44471.1 Chemotaxis protein CheC/response regulator domain protein [Pse
MSTLALLICDDSNMARKQLLRALPEDWDVSVTLATQGQEGLEAIRKGQGQVVLLDLTMPVMDGYQTLTAIRAENLDAKVIVVSGDVQDEAVRRVMELGALAFLKKPADPDELKSTLERLGLLGKPAASPVALPALNNKGGVISFQDAFRETVNVAMGRAAALLAKVLGVFVQLPVPNVNMLEVGELHMALADAHSDQRLTAVCQGYIGGGIAGEALLIFHDSEISGISQLMGGDHSDSSDMEMLLDLSTILIGACLSGIAEQIDIAFSQGHPQLLGAQGGIDELIRINQQRWKKTLAVEISYSVEGHNLHFDLLMLFTEDSVELLTKKLAYMMS